MESTANLDADDPLDDSDDTDSDSDSDDDTAALMAELHKIKQEKAQEEAEKVRQSFTKFVSLMFLVLCRFFL